MYRKETVLVLSKEDHMQIYIYIYKTELNYFQEQKNYASIEASHIGGDRMI
jgi:hypothetical protein